MRRKWRIAYDVAIVNANLPQIIVPPEVATAPRVALRRSAADLTFDERIPAELAARLRDPMAVLKSYGYSGKNAFNLIASPVFQVELKRALEQFIQGLTFRTRAKLMAADVLEHAYDLATDAANVAPPVRLAAQQWIAKMADLEPKEDKNTTNQAFQLVINLGP